MTLSGYITLKSTWMHALDTFSNNNKHANGHRTLREWTHEVVRSVELQLTFEFGVAFLMWTKPYYNKKLYTEGIGSMGIDTRVCHAISYGYGT